MENNKYLKILILAIIIGIVSYISYIGLKKYLDLLDTQKQIDTSLINNKELGSKDFANHLPYHSNYFDVYYSSINDEIQVILKTKALSFDENKMRNETDVANFLDSIGVKKADQQKVVWFKLQ